MSIQTTLQYNNSDIETEEPAWCNSRVGMKCQLSLSKPEYAFSHPRLWNTNRIVSLLSDKIVLDNFGKFTNKNASKISSKPILTPKSRITKWKGVTVPELIKTNK